MIDPIPSEFAGFVRETGIRAFDRLVTRARDLDAPLRNFVRSWSRLSEADKLTLFDELIIAARLPPEEETRPPAGMKQKHPVRRYDPEEVAATLPKKPAKRPAEKSAKKSKKRPQ